MQAAARRTRETEGWSVAVRMFLRTVGMCSFLMGKQIRDIFCVVDIWLGEMLAVVNADLLKVVIYRISTGKERERNGERDKCEERTGTRI